MATITQKVGQGKLNELINYIYKEAIE